MNPHATKKDFRDAFAGLTFPTSRSAIINRAVDQGGVDREVKRIVGELPNRTYNSLDDLHRAVRAIYVALGAPPDKVPV